ncbi:MAG: dephospho-CoA kinase [Turicibacter sp.]|nr:dephospho-CoA kinase [Turicibacter sp.]
MTKIIGITGNSGSGKTTVLGILEELGVATANADSIVHSLMELGKPVYIDILAAFGKDILAENGQIDRKKLGALVFNDITQRSLLENIVHPHVIRTILTEIKATERPFFAIDAVLLVESNLHTYCDEVWLIKARRECVIRRITARDALTEKEISDRLRNQRDTSKIESEVTIDNSESLECLRECVLSEARRLGILPQNPAHLED